MCRCVLGPPEKIQMECGALVQNEENIFCSGEGGLHTVAKISLMQIWHRRNSMSLREINTLKIGGRLARYHVNYLTFSELVSLLSL
jgi:hypothetical protein